MTVQCSAVFYQRQQVEKEVGVFAYQVVGLRAEVNKKLEATSGSLASIDDVGHVGGQDERCTVPAEGKAL